jgi:DNA-directed RNA polymerase specialized sigma24 family protein
MADAADVTALLLAWSKGDEAARSRLFEAVYDELRRLARGRLRRERPDLSLAPTVLVHEAYLKLIDQRAACTGRTGHTSTPSRDT